MSTVEKHYFALLRAALWDMPVSIAEEIDWKGVMGLARHQANGVLVYDKASQMTGSNKPSPELMEKMKNEMRGHFFHLMQLKQMLGVVLKKLRENNIEPLVLKGFGLALLYPNPDLRQMGDVDLFFNPDDFHQACELMRSIPNMYHWCMEWETGNHYNLDYNVGSLKFILEMHCITADLLDHKDKACYAAIECEGLYEAPQQVDLDGTTISIPSKEFMVFFAFYHAWHHFLTSGVGWRQISDVAMTLHAYNGQFDLNKLRQWFTGMHLMKPWQAFGFLMVEHLGLPQDEMPFYDASCRRTAQKLYVTIMKVGNFRRNNQFKRRQPKNKYVHKIHTFMGVFVDFFYRARVFPQVAFREMKISLKNGFLKQSKKILKKNEFF